jgi:hypothetical protein
LPIGKILCSILLTTIVTIPGIAQSVGFWTFNNTLAGVAGTYNTAGAAAFGPGIPTVSFNGASEYYGEDGWPTAAAAASTDYLQFSVSPKAGYQLDLTSVLLRIRRSNTGTPAGSGPTQWSLRSSLDGYASDIGSGSLVHTYNNYTVALSGFLNIYTTVTFRLYGYSVAVNSGGFSRLVADSISINGIGSLLPLQITGIQAAFDNSKQVNVQWQTSNIREGSVLNVERSVNGTDFTTINKFTEQQSKAAASYSYTDGHVPAAAAAVFYRIKINEPSGWTYVSWLVKMNNRQEKEATINYASVQGQSLLTSLQVTEKGAYHIQLFAADGRLLQNKQVILQAGINVFTLPLDRLSHGVYTISLYNNQLMGSKRFVY